MTKSINDFIETIYSKTSKTVHEFCTTKSINKHISRAIKKVTNVLKQNINKVKKNFYYIHLKVTRVGYFQRNFDLNRGVYHSVTRVFQFQLWRNLPPEILTTGWQCRREVQCHHRSSALPARYLSPKRGGSRWRSIWGVRRMRNRPWAVEYDWLCVWTYIVVKSQIFEPSFPNACFVSPAAVEFHKTNSVKSRRNVLKIK